MNKWEKQDQIKKEYTEKYNEIKNLTRDEIWEKFPDYVTYFRTLQHYATLSITGGL